MPPPGEALHLSLGRALGADEVRETHTSWVFLAGARAFKLKKPVRFGFVDLTTPQARRRMCEEEVRVNRVLAPGVVVGVRSVLRRGEELVLGEPGDEGAVDWVVEMRRFDERRTMAAVAARGDLTASDAARVGRRIARFHSEAPVVERADASRVVSDAWTRNLDELLPLARWELAEQGAALRCFAGGFLRRRAAELDARGRAGLVRDGHGDLRCEHVLLDEDVTIVDRLEFDPSLREVDVADDLAFLLMDLKATGVDWASRAVLAAYREAGGDAGDDALVAFFSAYRASVRAKVELLRAAQLDDGPGTARREERARGLLRLAEHCAWRARAPRVVVVCGPPASGKTHLAAALAARTGAPVLSSDLVRKELLGLTAGDHAPEAAYTDDERGRIYDELARRLRALPPEETTIVDATFGAGAVRDRFAAALDGEHRAALTWVECHAPLTTLVERASSRSATAAHASDAGPVVAARLAAAYERLAELPPSRHLRVDGTAPTDETLRRVGSWLDGAGPEGLSEGRPAAA
jgi:uncharacterized protein